MPYDHVAPADTFEQAVKILDHEGFRKEQADALAEGRYIGLGFSAYIEPTGAATGHLGTEGATIRMEPTGKINVYVNGGSSGNSIETTVVQLTADALGADIDDVCDDSGRHGGDAVRSGHAGQPQRPDDGGRRQRGGHDPAQADRRDGRPPAGRRRGRHRAGRLASHRPRRPDEERELRRHRLPLVLRTCAVAAGNGGHAGGHRALHLAGNDPLGQRHSRVHLRGGCRDRPRHADALHRQRGRRPDDQPECGRGADRGRHRAGHRRRAAGEHGLRRRRQPALVDVRRLPAADGHRGPADRVRPRRDPGTRRRRIQGLR